MKDVDPISTQPGPSKEPQTSITEKINLSNQKSGPRKERQFFRRIPDLNLENLMNFIVKAYKTSAFSLTFQLSKNGSKGQFFY